METPWKLAVISHPNSNPAIFMPCTEAVSSRENTRDQPYEHRVVSSQTPPEPPPRLQATEVTSLTAVQTIVQIKLVGQEESTRI
jgi:hypothetical protein